MFSLTLWERGGGNRSPPPCNKLRAIHLHIRKALLAQIQRLQTAHHPTLTPQQIGFALVEVAKFGAQLVERQRNHFDAFNLQRLFILLINAALNFFLKRDKEGN